MQSTQKELVAPEAVAGDSRGPWGSSCGSGQAGQICVDVNTDGDLERAVGSHMQESPVLQSFVNVYPEPPVGATGAGELGEGTSVDGDGGTEREYSHLVNRPPSYGINRDFTELSIG